MSRASIASSGGAAGDHLGFLRRRDARRLIISIRHASRLRFCGKDPQAQLIRLRTLAFLAARIFIDENSVLDRRDQLERQKGENRDGHCNVSI
jgi:hypothetical protein